MEKEREKAILKEKEKRDGIENKPGASWASLDAKNNLLATARF